MGNLKKKQKKTFKEEMKGAILSIADSVSLIYLVLLFVVLVFFAPEKYIHIGSYKIGFYEKTTMVFVALSMILIVFHLLWKRKHKVKTDFSFLRTDGILLLYGIWNLLSFLAGSNKEGTVLGFDGWHLGLLIQLSFVYGFYVILTYLKSRRSALYAAVFAFALESGMILLQRCGNDPFGFYKEMDWFEWNRRNLIGTIGNINWTCGYLIVMFPVAAGLFYRAGKLYQRILLGVSLYLGMAAILLQSSNSGIAALIAVLLVLYFFSLEDSNSLLRYLEILFLLFLFLSLMSVFRVDLIEPEGMNSPDTWYSIFWLIPAGILLGAVLLLGRRNKKKGCFVISQKVRRIAYIFPVCILVTAAGVLATMQLNDALWAVFDRNPLLRLKDSGGSYRILLWKETVRHFFSSGGIRNLLFGVGPDGFGYWFEESGILIPVSGQFQDAVYANAHNEFITCMVNLGIPGVILYIAFFVNTLIRFLKAKGHPWRMTGILLIAAYTVNQFFSFQQLVATPLFIFLIALLSGKEEKQGKTAQ